MNKPTIEIRSLSTGYRGKNNVTVVAHDINATIYGGELTCLLGPNGAGKSTLLRTLSAFLPPVKGEITIMGRNLNDYSDKELAKTIGVVLTEKTDLRNMSVEDLIGLGRSPYTIPIHIPALRERKADIPLLFRKFAVDFCTRYQMPPLSLNEEATQLLQNSYWRGNIRQLKNLAEQISIIELDHQINAETLRKYLPAEENRQEIVLRNPSQESGKDYSHEIGILYNMVMQNRKELEELKALNRNTIKAVGIM